MCGFSVYNKKEYTASSAFEKSKKFVQFRGLDDTQLHEEEKYFFVHHRLSIVDHENGSQPLCDDHGVLVFNGEIHNYQKLGKEYFNFEFTGDSQFLLSLCGHQRFDLLSEIDGYFSFVYYDRAREKIIAARDLYGEKPLYAAKNFQNFSSSLNDVGNLRKKTLAVKLESLFADEREDWQKILFDEFFEIPPNTIIQVNTDGELLSHETIYSHTALPFDSMSFMKSFNQAVYDRLIADVPVSQSLSGGKDSGLVNMSLVQANHDIPRFTIKNTKHEFDESGLVEKIAKQYDIQLSVIALDEKLGPEDLMKILVYQEVPSWDLSFIGFYSYYLQVAKSAKVIIEGHGPDELHGGYQDYLLVKLIQAIIKTPKMVTKISEELRSKTGRSAISLSWSAILFLLRGIILGKREYISLKHYWKKQDKRLSSVLAVFDRATMHAQIESRSPFLSQRLLPYFQTYRNEVTAENETKPYITKCLFTIDEKYPVLQKKIGFTFGNNDAYLKYSNLLLTKKQMLLISLIRYLLPKKLTNRLIMLELFHTAHVKFRSQ